MMVARPRAARIQLSTTLAIRYSGATRLRSTRASSRAMASAAIGTMWVRSPSEVDEMSARAAASPATPQSVAPTDRAALLNAARI